MDRSLIIWIVVAVVLLDIPIFLFIFKRRQQILNQQKDVLQAVANQRGGRVQVLNFLSPPLMNIPVHDRELVFQTIPGGTKKPALALVSCVLSNYHGPEFQISSADQVSDFIVKAFKAQDITLNSPEFDSKFIVKSADQIGTMNFLSHEVQSALLSLSAWKLVLWLGRQAMNLKVYHYATDPGEINTILDVAKTIVDRIRRTA